MASELRIVVPKCHTFTADFERVIVTMPLYFINQ